MHRHTVKSARGVQRGTTRSLPACLPACLPAAYVQSEACLLPSVYTPFLDPVIMDKVHFNHVFILHMGGDTAYACMVQSDGHVGGSAGTQDLAGLTLQPPFERAV